MTAPSNQPPLDQRSARRTSTRTKPTRSVRRLFRAFEIATARESFPEVKSKDAERGAAVCEKQGHDSGAGAQVGHQRSGVLGGGRRLLQHTMFGCKISEKESVYIVTAPARARIERERHSAGKERNERLWPHETQLRLNLRFGGMAG